MCWQRVLVLFAGCIMGCAGIGGSRVETFLSRHYVLREEAADKLDGPYKMRNVLSSIDVAVEKDDRLFSVRLRGCRSTGQEELDLKARKLLGTMWLKDVYLRKDSTFSPNATSYAGVIYDTANRIALGRDDKGKQQYRNLTYAMPQLLLLTHGYCLLDRSDTNYPLYQVFLDAEDLAKKNRAGCWEKQRE